MFWRLPDDRFFSKKHILNWNWHELSGCYYVVQEQVSRSSANTTFGFLSKNSSSRFREITSSFTLNLKISTALRSGWLVIFRLPPKTAMLHFHWELDPKVWTLRGVPSVMLWTSSLIEGIWSMVSLQVWDTLRYHGTTHTLYIFILLIMVVACKWRSLIAVNVVILILGCSASS